MKMKKIKRLAVFLALSLCLSCLPQTAFATSVGKITTNFDEIFGARVNTDNPAKIAFGKSSSIPGSWYVVGYNGKGTANYPGYITLLAWSGLKESQFDATDNEYADSSLKTKIDTYVTFSELEKSAVTPRTLESGVFNGQATNCIAGPSITVSMWPLSTKEANELNSTILTSLNYFWLRSPGEAKDKAALVYGGVPGASGAPVTNKSKVVPALWIKKDSVLMATDMYTPKPSGPLGANSLQAVPVAAGTKDWRLTLLDPARSAFDAALTSTDKTSVTLAYSGAQVGSNEYLSAVLMDNGGNLTYYGRVKALETMADASGHVKINIPAGVTLGTNAQLYVFNENLDMSKSAIHDYSSALKKIDIGSAPATSGKLTATDPDGRTWTVEVPASAPDALNGADTLKIEKNAKGNYVAKLFKGGAEISSRGLLWVYQPIPAGVTAKKIKVDGVETTFSVVGNTWKYAAEFKK